MALMAEAPRMHKLAQAEANATAITVSLRRCIEQLCAKLGAKVHREIYVDLYRTGVRRTGEPYRKQGRVDLAVVLPDGWRIAIEIDRGHKRWSQEKLVHVATLPGACSLWIRWRGEFVDEDCAGGISLINLTEEVPAFLDHWAANYGKQD